MSYWQIVDSVNELASMKYISLLSSSYFPYLSIPQQPRIIMSLFLTLSKGQKVGL